jgi:hypothetical protein
MKRVCPVPASDAPIEEIVRFAHSYYGYDRAGGFGPLAEKANLAVERWHQAGVLPDGLNGCRSALFFEVRRQRFVGGLEDDPSQVQYLRSLTRRIHELSNGAVPDDRQVRFSRLARAWWRLHARISKR